MKKYIAILLIALVSLSAFAATDWSTYDFNAEIAKADYADVLKPFAPTDTRALGMGSAGLALTETAASMWSNPASLGAGNAAVSLPSVGVTFHHIYDLLEKDDEGVAAWERIQAKAEEDPISVSGLVSEVAEILGSGYGAITTIDASTAIRLKSGFGFGVYVNDEMKTYSDSGALASKFINQTNVSALVGYGTGVDLGIAKLDIGVNAKLNYTAFTKGLSISSLSDNLDDVEAVIYDTPMFYGTSTPITVGAAIEFPVGLRATAVVTDIMNKYTYTVNTIQDYMDEVETVLAENIEVEIPATLNVGVAYTSKGAIKGSLAADILDVASMVDEINNGIDPKRAAMTHLNAGLELDLLNLVEARAGLSQGYASVGASFNLLVFRVDAAYYWKEYGKTTGQSPVDGLSLRFNLGWEK